MNAIWKYPLSFDADNEIKMPRYAEVLSVQSQKDGLVLWAMVDTDESLDTRQFQIIGTGWRMEDDCTRDYIATVQMPSGLVWHVFAVYDKFQGEKK